MKKSISLILSAVLALTLVFSAFAETADTVVYGKIYTSDKNRPWAEAMAVRDGKFVYVGDAEGAKEYIGENTEVITRDGGMITPGLFDAHTHPASVGKSAWHVRMGLPDYDGILRFITQYLAEHDAQEAPFVYFEYYPTNLFGPKAPTKPRWTRSLPTGRSSCATSATMPAGLTPNAFSCWASTTWIRPIRC